jgi:hypothetical protein
MGVRMTYIPLPQEKEGGVTKVLTTDNSVKEILLEILTELKKMNVQFEILTDTKIEEGDL